MDISHLKSAVNRITLPEEAADRIIRNCASGTAQKENTIMKKPIRFKKPATLAAVLALCLCLTVAASAAVNSGQFRDILGFGGTVVGTAYENATQEIRLESSVTEHQLTLTATFLDPEAFPYRELEALALGTYQILDSQDNVIVQGDATDFSPIADGCAVLTLDLTGLEQAPCRLVVTGFIGSKKADQPLPITGSWTCDLG